jgi:hypothetical protein
MMVLNMKMKARHVFTKIMNTLKHWKSHVIRPVEIDEGERWMNQSRWWHRPSKRQQAIIALTHLRDIRAVKPLIHCLKSHDSHLREHASTALVEIGQPAVAPLLETMLDEQSFWRGGHQASSRQYQAIKNTLFCLGEAAIPSCIQALSHLSLACQIKEILREFPGDEVLPLFVAALEHEQDTIRGAIAEVLEQRAWSPKTPHQRTAYAIARGTITRVVFAQPVKQDEDSAQTLCNPECAALHIPIQGLRQIDIDTTSYDFYQLERFLTYLVNTLDQAYLKRCVTVNVYGNEKEFSDHLMNLLTNLCQAVLFIQ